jgi:hypothetical protein
LTAGSGGIIYKCTFQKGPNINSPFVGFRPLQTVEPIHTIILKVIIIHKRGTTPVGFAINRDEKISVYEDDYDNEIEMQHNIVLDTIDFLEPSCPVILYNNKYDTLDTKTGFMVNVVETYFKNKLLKNIVSAVTKLENISIGFIAMECAAAQYKFNSLFNLTRIANNVEQNNYIILGIYEIMKLAYAGYIHGDHHFGNIMIATDYQFYFNPEILPEFTYLRAFIIDLGRAFKLSPDDHSSIRSKIDNYMTNPTIEQWMDILVTIKYHGCYYRGTINKEFTSWSGYMWLVDPKIITPANNELCRKLFDSYNNQKYVNINNLYEYLKVIGINTNRKNIHNLPELNIDNKMNDNIINMFQSLSKYIDKHKNNDENNVGQTSFLNVFNFFGGANISKLQNAVESIMQKYDLSDILKTNGFAGVICYALTNPETEYGKYILKSLYCMNMGYGKLMNDKTDTRDTPSVDDRMSIYDTMPIEHNNSIHKNIKNYTVFNKALRSIHKPPYRNRNMNTSLLVHS